MVILSVDLRKKGFEHYCRYIKIISISISYNIFTYVRQRAFCICATPQRALLLLASPLAVYANKNECFQTANVAYVARKWFAFKRRIILFIAKIFLIYMKLDKIDRKILQILQDDSSLPLEQIALQVNLTPTPAWRRIQKLEQTGVIERRVVICNAELLGVGVTVFVAIKTEQHNAQWLDKFARGVRDIPEVLELHRMSGDIDYLLKVVTPDIRSYDTVYKKLIKVADLSDVSSSFSMERIKYTTALPVDYAG